MSNFLGKKISLISKALIRYEGVLYTIDQSAFTVALSKVKSFGTEERPAERFIAARDEVYEYIIFRGSDISDLHVCESSVYADDSAIVKIMSPNVTNPSSPPVLSSPQEVNVDISASDSIAHPDEPLSPQININKRFMNLSKTNNRNDKNYFVNSQEQFNKPRNNYHTYTKKYECEDIEKIAAHDYRQFKNREQVNKSDSYDNSANEESRQYFNYRRGAARRGTRGSYDSGSARGYMSTAARGRHMFMSNKDILSLESIKDDFDFESSNALMAEELANMQVTHIENPATGNTNRGLYPREDTAEHNNDDANTNDEDEKVFYDKSKSFFDNISCEVCDHSGGSMGDRRRRNNAETFGCSDYGRGSRGGYRGFRWNGARGAFRGNYGGGSSAGFIRRGGNTRREDGMVDYRDQFTQRRLFAVNVEDN